MDETHNEFSEHEGYYRKKEEEFVQLQMVFHYLKSRLDIFNDRNEFLQDRLSLTVIMIYGKKIVCLQVELLKELLSIPILTKMLRYESNI